MFQNYGRTHRQNYKYRCKDFLVSTILHLHVLFVLSLTCFENIFVLRDKNCKKKSLMNAVFLLPFVFYFGDFLNVLDFGTYDLKLVLLRLVN